MPSRFRHLLTLVAALPAVAVAQQPRSLPAPDATFEEPFSAVNGLRELSNGRVLVADARDKTFQLLDLSAGTATPVGREGNGPGEYALPFRVLRARGDTTFLYDIGNQRYLVIGGDGKASGEFRQEENAPPARRDGPASQAPAGPVFRVGLSTPRASDAQGRIYLEGSPMAPGPDGRPVQADSVVLLRYDRVAKRSDTLTFLRIPKSVVQTSGGQGNVTMRVTGPNPLLPRDEWAVFPDGRVAIVRSPEYRVDWVMPDLSRVMGRAIAFTPLRMTEADKREEEELRNRNRGNAVMMSVNSGGGGTQRSVQMGGGSNQPPLEPLTDWPAVKPPFRAGLASVWARPNGELWVRRTEAAGAKGALYDVINAQGAVTHQIRFAEGLNLVGFGNGTVYTTKADEDDLLYLQRHRVN